MRVGMSGRGSERWYSVYVLVAVGDDFHTIASSAADVT